MLEQHLHHARLLKGLAIEPDRLGVGHLILQAKPEEPHKRQPIAHLIFNLVVRQVVERAQHQRLEHEHGVIGFRQARHLRSGSGLRQTRSRIGRNSSQDTTA
ncbi:hypothetical protein P775_12200 [Puniceibacterium antarcticum]|uniref:Uncharacterized protein n=1 Tax=Puniceibacterium antarcticum TaxID=1206336 RepID=A0A2G8RES7_9RHOB|nr:hypothetical protein P775_12200 [Puniceibacterium antarcticum]